MKFKVGLASLILSLLTPQLCQPVFAEATLSREEIYARAAITEVWEPVPPIVAECVDVGSLR